MDEEQDLIDRIRAMASDGETQPVVTPAQRTDYLSGTLQSALALGTSYLSRRIDIDLQSRIAGMQPEVIRPSNQRPVSDHAGVTPQWGLSAGMGSLMPWLIGAVVLFGGAALIFRGR